MFSQEKNSEIWLKGNLRHAITALILPAILLVLFLGSAIFFWSQIRWVAVISLILMMFDLVVCIAVLMNAMRPRVARVGDSVLFYLPGPKPIVVPLEYVECFLMASGVTTLPGKDKREVQTQNIVIRLAERVEEEWGHREIPLEIGKWCQGQVTIRGLHCEPISVDKVQQLNVKLYEAQHGTTVPVSMANSSVAGSPRT